MKTNTKRLLSMIVALVMILSMLPVMAFAADGTTLYLTPNANWKNDNARFAIYTWGGSSGEQWISMTLVEGETNLYQGTIPSGYSNIIFCRMNPSTSANSWDNKWNQTSDLTVPTDGNNHYTVASGTWDKGGGTWSTYTPPAAIPEWESPIVSGDSVTFNFWSSEELTAVNVCGSMADWNPGVAMIKNEETGIWSATITDLYNGDYEYKFVLNADYTEGWTDDPKNPAEIAGGNSAFSITESVDEPELPIDPTDPEEPVGYPETVYFLPNFNWTGDGATFAAYFYNDTTYQWVSMVDTNGDGVYEAAVPEDMTSVIFCRMNPAAAEPSWDSKWNQSSDLAIPTDGTDLLVMTQGTWDSSSEDAPWAGAWETYVEPTVPEITSPITGDDFATINYWHYNATSVSVWGSFNGWKSSVALTKQEDGSWSVTLPILYYGTFEYKLVVDNQWITDPNNTDEISPDGNSVFHVGTPVAEIYDVGVYYTFESAYAAVDSENGYVVILLADVTVDGLAIDKELYLDLNGHNATFTNTTGEETIWVQDSATTDVTTTQWGTLITDANYDCLGGYVMLPEAEGHSFHSFDVIITHVSLQPGNDALGFKATVNGDSAVLAAVTGYGFDMSVADGNTITRQKEEALNDSSFSLRLKNILACGGGEMEVTGEPFVIMNGEKFYGTSHTTTMMETIQKVDSNWDSYKEDQKTAVNNLMSGYADLITKWNLSNISIAE